AGASLWFAQPEPSVYIAVLPVGFGSLRKSMQVSIFRSDEHVAPIDKMNQLGITEGDFAYVLGFPMGLTGRKRNGVIVRSGSIARIRDTLARNNPEFLIDS